MGEKERGAHQNGGHYEMARVQVQRTHCSCSLYVRVCWKPPSLPPINSTNSTNSVIGRSVIVACHNQKSTSCLLLAKEKKIRLPHPVDARFVYVSFVRCKNYGPLRKRKRKEREKKVPCSHTPLQPVCCLSQVRRCGKKPKERKNDACMNTYWTRTCGKQTAR